VVYHLHSATADTIKSKTFKAYYLNRNRFLMMFKNFSGKDLWRGLLLVPKSFLEKDKSDKDGRDDEINKNKQNTTDRVSKNKIRMIGVLVRISGSLLFNMPKIIQQRRLIQSRALIR
jgi:hypothetical protein